MAQPPLVTTAKSPATLLQAPHFTESERNFGRLLKLGCLAIIALAVVYVAMEKLKAILIPFMLALALSYLLTPLIDALSCRHDTSCRYRMPRGLAVFISILVACAVLGFIVLVLLQAVASFRARSSLYAQRTEALLNGLFGLLARYQAALVGGGEPSAEGEEETATQMAQEMVTSFLKDISITNLLLSLLGTAAHIVEDVMYILLFLVFLLASAPKRSEQGPVTRKVTRQIFVYIRGKGGISAFVGGCHALVLWLVGLDLWLPFGVVTFFLNFIPAVGGIIAVCLPMPLVALDQQFSGGLSIAAFLVPFIINLFARDVLEPTLIGQSTSLHPVVVLLAILLYGSVWGITGMVMAIPLTAVLRIVLSSIEHPLPRALARFLAGESEHETAALSRQESLDDDMWRHHHQHQDQYRAGGDDESAALPASFLHLASDRTYSTAASPPRGAHQLAAEDQSGNQSGNVEEPSPPASAREGTREGAREMV